MLEIYGIPNCDTVQKAIKWIKTNEIEYEFHDFRKDGISPKKINEWLKKVPLEKLLNKVSATYKAIPADEKPSNEIETVALMVSKPACIKRPVIEIGKKVLVGLDLAIYEKEILGKNN